ncbi:hypothetical protein [Chamaesiphon sp.]
MITARSYVCLPKTLRLEPHQSRYGFMMDLSAMLDAGLEPLDRHYQSRG